MSIIKTHYVMRHRTFILSIITIITQLAFARVTSGKNFYNNIGFEQNYNIYKWIYGFDYQKQINQNSFILIKEDFNSSLLRIRENEKKWKDDQSLNIDYSYRYSNKCTGLLSSSSTIFSDKLSGITNDIKTTFGSFGVSYTPIEVINISSKLGYKFDERFDQLDHGVLYFIDLNTPFINVNDYHNKFNFSASGDNFQIRKNRDINFNYSVNKKFYVDTSDSLAIMWYKKRRDNYDLWARDELFIESLFEDLGKLSHTLNYKINEWSRVKLVSHFSTRSTKVSKSGSVPQKESRSKKDFLSSNELSFNINMNHLRERIKITYATESQKNEVPDSLKDSPFSYRFSYISPDYRSSRLSLTNVLDYAFSKKDTVVSNFAVSIFRYDTPEESNYDDRDELSIHANLSETHYFNHWLKLRSNISVNLKHIVFIYGEKSANNNWMRIFKLNPAIDYCPGKKFKSHHSFEVLANYVAYDFEQELTPVNIRSYVFRKFMMEHILRYQFSRFSTVNLNYKLELEENGKFYWDKWSEILLSTRQNNYIKTYIDFEFLRSLKISLGAVFLNRNEHFQIESNTIDKISNNYISYGPSCLIDYYPNEKLKFDLSITRRRVDQVHRSDYYISNMSVNLLWYF